MTSPLASLSVSEISRDDMSQGHGWPTTSATPGTRSGYNSGYNSASGYVSRGAGSGTGSPGSSNSRSMAERPAGNKRRGSTSMRLAEEDPSGSDGESELGLSMCTDTYVFLCCD
jgi:hypothetical protein